ncbi:hypothetical protein [Bradyrhizobium yuanmingense]|nr:hypothetical protein [Bradyrhizobium yuanmingense]
MAIKPGEAQSRERSFSEPPEREPPQYADRELALAMLEARVQMHQEEHRTARFVAIIVGAVAALFGFYGVWLTALGAGDAQSTVKLFGQELTTTSVGLGIIFIAGLVLWRVLVRVLNPR